MQYNKHLHGLAICVCLLFISGCATTIQLSSLPDDADVTIRARSGPHEPWVTAVQVKTPSVYKIQNHAQFFGKHKQARIDLLFKKEGYANFRTQPMIAKRQENRIPLAELEPLNTFIGIETTPEGAMVSFYESGRDATNQNRAIAVPLGDTLNIAMDSPLHAGVHMDVTRGVQRVTPVRIQCSPSLAKMYFSRIAFVRIDLPGYVPIIEPLQVLPGVSKTRERILVPAQVNLNIRSRPPGAVVEDWRPAGFGKLGETDLERQITYEELARRPEFLNRGRLILNLRAFKDGYGEWTRDDIEIPLGDTYELEFHLPPRQSPVRIDSEPAGASVYVYRTKRSDDLADREPVTGEPREHRWKRHMGTTPFTYNIDSSDPFALKHGDQVFFEKQGYESTEVFFVRGATVLHGKLDPQRPAER